MLNPRERAEFTFAEFGRAQVFIANLSAHTAQIGHNHPLEGVVGVCSWSREYRGRIGLSQFNRTVHQVK